MPEEKEKEFKREPGSCVIHDDNHGWGGPQTDEKEVLKEKIPTNDPINWPFNRFR